ncbi:MAG: YfiR family protein [Polyangia bacterium]
MHPRGKNGFAAAGGLPGEGARRPSAIRGQLGRMAALALWVCLYVWGGVARTYAEDVAVPLSMQVQLFASVADYDKGFAERAHGKAKILLLTANDPDSAHAAAQVTAALARIGQIAGQAHEETVIQFESGGALLRQCRERAISVVFVMPGLQAALGDIRHSLDGVNVLSVATVGSYVQQGVVLGFDVVSGKPKLLVNLAQARAQKVNFKAELLKMVKVVE